MKIISKEVKDCEFTNWEPTKVLEIVYTHRSKEHRRILVKDYNENDEKNILKQLRVAVREDYILRKENANNTNWDK